MAYVWHHLRQTQAIVGLGFGFWTKNGRIIEGYYNHSMKGRLSMKSKTSEQDIPAKEPESLSVRQIGQTLYNYLAPNVTHLAEPKEIGGAGPFIVSAQLDCAPNRMMTFELVDEDTFLTDPAKETFWIDDDALVKKIFTALKLPKEKRNFDQYDVLTFRAIPDTPACKAALIELEREDHDKACAVYLIKKGEPPHSSEYLFHHPKCYTL